MAPIIEEGGKPAMTEYTTQTTTTTTTDTGHYADAGAAPQAYGYGYDYGVGAAPVTSVPVVQTTAATTGPRHAEHRGRGSHTAYMVLLVILAFVLPPAAVLLRTGLSWDFALNILLWILGWIPGIIHALIVIFVGPLFGYGAGMRETRHAPGQVVTVA